MSAALAISGLRPADDPDKTCATCEHNEYLCSHNRWYGAGLDQPKCENDKVCDGWEAASLRIGNISTYYGYLLMDRFADGEGIVRWHWGIESYMGVKDWEPIPDYLVTALLRYREECPEKKI